MITDADTLVRITFDDGEWLILRNRGWGIFEVTAASIRTYLTWQYHLNPRGIVAATWPHIDLYNGHRFFFMSRSVVGIERIDTWN